MKNKSVNWWLGTGVLAAAMIYCILCGLGVTNTFWGWDSRHSGILWKVVMFLFLGGGLFVAVKGIGG